MDLKNLLRRKNELLHILQQQGINQQQYNRALHLYQKTEQMIQQLQPPQQTPQQPLRNTYNPSTGTKTISIQHQPQPQSMVERQQHQSGALEKEQWELDEMEREIKFKQEELLRRKKFLEEQKKRRQAYEQRLKSLEQSNVDSLKIMNLHEHFTHADLKKSYKLLALKFHPDRPTGDKQKFQLITECYLSLLEKLKQKEERQRFETAFSDLAKQEKERQYQQVSPKKSRDATEILKQQYETLFSSPKQNKKQPALVMDPNSSSQGFNVKLFNKLYEENKLWDPNDDGYDEWFRDESAGASDHETPPQLFSDKFNINVFNATFDNWKDLVDEKSQTDIVEYNAPKELIAVTTPYSTIDGSKPIDDFTKPMDMPGSINYTDLKKAYTENNRFINPNRIPTRKNYKSIEELKRDRGHIKDLTPEEWNFLKQQEEKEKYEEEQRIKRLELQQQIQAEHYRQIHQNAIGYRADPEL